MQAKSIWFESKEAIEAQYICYRIMGTIMVLKSTTMINWIDFNEITEMKSHFKFHFQSILIQWR